MMTLYGKDQKLLKEKFYFSSMAKKYKIKKYPKWRLDLIFSKKKYSNLLFIKNGGWHFTCIRNARDLEKNFKFCSSLRI